MASILANLLATLLRAALAVLLALGCACLAGMLARRIRRADLLRIPRPTLAVLLVLALAAVVLSDKPGTNGTNRACARMSVRRIAVSTPLAAGVTDEDVTNGWREVSRSTNALESFVFALPDDGLVWEAARARGVRRGYWPVPATNWSFSGTGFAWTNGFVWAEGMFRPKVESKRDRLQILNHGLALAPAANWARYNLDASLFWCRTNAVGGLVGTFLGAAVDDDPAKIVNAQFELFPSNACIALRYDLSRAGEGEFEAGPFEDGVGRFVTLATNTSEVVLQRVHPDDWDMDGLPNWLDDDPRVPAATSSWGQSDAWAAHAFPSNTSEIATAGGYLAWATARGAETNRHLVALHIASPNGVWPVCLTFGDLKVMCNGAETLTFVIDDGARYAFSLSDGAVLQSVDFGNGEERDEPWCAWPTPSDYLSGNDITLHMDSAQTGWIGRVPTVQVDGLQAEHFYPGSSRPVSGVVTNCHAEAYLGCRWSGGDGLTFSDATSRVTVATWNGNTKWATNVIRLVTSYEGNYSLTNEYVVSVGNQPEPDTEFNVSCQEIFFLNDAEILSDGSLTNNRPERIRPVRLNLKAACGTQGFATVSSTGEAQGILFRVDENAETNRYESGTSISLNVASNSLSREVGTIVYLSCPTLGKGTLEVSYSISNGVSVTTNVQYRVIEPIQKRVCNRSGGIFEKRLMLNPSRLVYGTNAVLCVSVNTAHDDDYAPTNISWRVVSGNASIIGVAVTNKMSAAKIVPTNDAGEVVVEARFNGDEIQPRFSLPVVTLRTIPVRIFVASPPWWRRAKSWNIDEIKDQFSLANLIFSQVGINFDLQGDITVLSGSSSEWDLVTDRAKGSSKDVESYDMGDQPGRLFDHYQANDCIEIYYVGNIKSDWNPSMAAFHYANCVVISKSGAITVLAHELGHALGLLDSFEKTAYGKGLALPGGDESVSRRFFSSVRDWGAESGRGFYERSDTGSATIFRLLMSSIPNATYELGQDIPDGAVLGFGEWAAAPGDESFLPVGASQIQPDNGKVFSK